MLLYSLAIIIIVYGAIVYIMVILQVAKLPEEATPYTIQGV